MTGFKKNIDPCYFCLCACSFTLISFLSHVKLLIFRRPPGFGFIEMDDPRVRFRFVNFIFY